ncbi:hypothetical protein AVEN_103702-1 [Araneus ventricosus]|uniref:Uncharacterized protein n=1 Tax=Araneus ventricosus TaxID=182803 RepID=A0A4Y2R799_ARAVE|nr:hypothetical protein AVEN_103702-1 [Araneus ventricosus]
MRVKIRALSQNVGNRTDHTTVRIRSQNLFIEGRQLNLHNYRPLFRCPSLEARKHSVCGISAWTPPLQMTYLNHHLLIQPVLTLSQRSKVRSNFAKSITL